MRWLLSEATSAAGDVANLLETRGDVLDEDARALLREDALILEDELETLKAQLLAPADWDAEYSGCSQGRSRRSSTTRTRTRTRTRTT